MLCALNAAGVPPDDPAVRRAVAWLVSVQREDGGWGEDEETYGDAPHGRYKESTPSQTAWALLGLMAAGEADHPAVARGIDYLTRPQRDDGEWRELPYNAVGFPRVFYLRYHGYRLVFPAAGTGALPQPAVRQHAQGGIWLLIRRVGVVVGLAAEARIARRLGWPVAVGGGTAAGAEDRSAAPRRCRRGAWSASAWRAGSIRRCGRAH